MWIAMVLLLLLLLLLVLMALMVVTGLSRYGAMMMTTTDRLVQDDL